MDENYTFLARIKSPALTSPTFAAELAEAFDNIDDNFKKIVGAPYLEGQRGQSVETVDMLLVSNGKLTAFGKAAAREIFSDPSIETLEDIDRIAIRVGPAAHSAGDYLIYHPAIKVFCTRSEDSGEIEQYICSAEYYYFLDMRVEDLGKMDNPSSQSWFVDYTCQLFADFRDGSWHFTRGVMLPTLYYNSDQASFCWKINSVETGIHAQGLKGDNGRPPVAAVVRGIGTTLVSNTGTPVTKITVSKYLPLTSEVVQGETILTAEWADVSYSDIQNGDLVCCLFSYTDPLFHLAHPDMVIGNVNISGGMYSITVPEECCMSSLWKSYLAYYAFHDIDYKSTSQNKTKAVFVPAYNANVTHAMFQDDSGVVYSGSGTDWSSEDTLHEDNLVFKKVNDNRLIGEGSVGEGNQMTRPEQGNTETVTKAKFIGYRVEGNVGGLPGVELGTPVGSIVNWIDMVHIPEGWYQVGETTQSTLPVFGFKFVSNSAAEGEYDILVERPNHTVLKKSVVTGINSNGGLGNRDKRFMKIYSVLSGNAYGEPIRITRNNYNGSVDTIYSWNDFDCRQVSGGILFYLTKQV